MARQALPATQPRRKVGRLLANVAVASLVAVSLVSPAHAADHPLPYIDTEGVLQEHTSGYTLMQDANPDALNGWYLCEGPTDLGPLRVAGVAHLVLADDCDLTAQGTVDRTPGIRLASGNQLSIYAQSTGDQQGRVTATGTVKELGASAGAGIGTSEGSERFGNLTIAGGYIAATGAGGAAAGIGTSFRGTGGSVTVTGGTVDAQSGMYAAGIGGGQQGAMETINITGGTVTARGGSVGIGASSTHYGTGSVTIAGDASVTTINGGPRPALGTENHSPGGNDPVTVSVATTGVVTTERTWGTGPTIGYGQTATAWLVTTEVTGDGTLLPRGLADLPEGATQGTFSIPVGDGESMTFDAQPGPELETLWLTLDGERLTELDYHTLGDVQRDHTLSAGFGVMQTVSAASIDLDAPEFGEPLATTATTSDLDYTVQSLEWDPAHTTGASATPYTATVVLTPEPGHIFDGSTAATVNGNAATAALEDNGALTVTHTFPTTDQAIANAALTIEAPVFGESLATTATTSDTDYTVESLEWDPNDEPADSATDYTVTATLEAASSYIFTDDVTATVGGNPVDAQNVTLNADGTLTVIYTFPTTDQEIPSAALFVDDPVFDKALDSPMAGPDANYTIASHAWDPAGPTGASDTSHAITATLAPKPGHAFGPNTIAAVNNADAAATLAPDGTLQVTHTFDATDTWVDEVDLTLPAPVVGESLADAVTRDADTYTAELTWLPERHEPAQSVTDYRAGVLLTPRDGYAFNASTAATLNNDLVTAVFDEDEGTLTVAYDFPTTEQAIDSVVIDIAAPVFDQYLATGATLPSDANYSVDSIDWDTTDTHAASHTVYTATVTLKPDGGHAFVDTTATVNMADASVTLASDGTLRVTYTFDATDTWVENAALSLEAPQVAQDLATSATTTDVGFSMSDVLWSPADGTAQSVTAYTATVVLTPLDGYVFNPTSAASINGDTATAVLEADGTLKVSYEFDPTDQAIAAAALDIEVPVFDQALAGLATTSDTTYTAQPLAWLPADAVGAPGQAYTATVSLLPADGFAFVEATTATVGGDAADVVLEADGTLTVTYEFPPTDRNTVDVTVADFETEFTYGDQPFLVTANAAATPTTGDSDDIAPMGMFSLLSSPAGTPTVPVAFTSSDPSVATVTDHGNGTATVTILRAGTFTLSASTEPTPTLHRSQVDTEITVLEATPTLTLTSGTGSISAAVAGAGDTPRGTVTFYVDGNVWEANVPLVDGTATIDLDGLAPGARSITATFNGDRGYYTTAPQSGVLSITITAPEQPASNADGTLPVTGGTAQYALIATAVALVFLGAMLALIRQRRRNDPQLG